MDTEQRKKAQAMHKDFYDKINLAIEDGFYFEAYIREYNAMEARMKVIMGILGMPCEVCKNEDLTNAVGIGTKLNCLRSFLDNKPLFEKSKLTKKVLREINSWTQVRNKAIHRLYYNPEMYETTSRQIKEYSVKGKEYVRLIYNETERLKRLKKRKPELFIDSPSKCHVNKETQALPETCIPVIKTVNEGSVTK